MRMVLAIWTIPAVMFWLSIPFRAFVNID